MNRIYIAVAALAIGFMGYQDYRGASMFGRRADGAGWFAGSGARRGPDGRMIGGSHSYNHK